MSNVARRAILVVGRDFHHHRDAARTVPLVHQLFVIHPGKLARAALDRLLHVVAGHIGFFGVVHGFAQARIVFEDAAADLGGNRNFANDLREELAALNVGNAFFVFDACPS